MYGPWPKESSTKKRANENCGMTSKRLPYSDTGAPQNGSGGRVTTLGSHPGNFKPIRTSCNRRFQGLTSPAPICRAMVLQIHHKLVEAAVAYPAVQRFANRKTSKRKLWYDLYRASLNRHEGPARQIRYRKDYIGRIVAPAIPRPGLAGPTISGNGPVRAVTEAGKNNG